MPAPAKYPENEEVLAALRFVHREIAALRGEVAKLLSGAAQAPAAPAVAPDHDLDGPHGDEDVKRDPPRWKGAPTAPCRMSECPPGYLDELAEFFDFKASSPRAGKEKYVPYDRKSAARARGWAARKRAQIATGDEL
jgi:hypothetical protein